MEISVVDKIDKKDEAVIFQGLLEFNHANLEDKHPRELGVYSKDEDGEIQAGLTGSTHGNWMMVKYLWVSPELRGQQMGSKLLREAEKAAIARGCKYAFLDTFSFQAPAFYEKQGYKEVFVLEEYPLTGKRHYFTKELV